MALLIPRRKFLTGAAALVAAPAILKLARAQNTFPGAKIPNPQFKPTGTPSGINSSSPLFTTPPLFYGVDDGAGTISDITGNVTMTKFGLGTAPIQDSPGYGRGFYWDARNCPGLTMPDGVMGWAGAATTAINNAQNLMSLGTGAAWVHAASGFVAGPGDARGGGMIGGRPANALENVMYPANWVFGQGSNGQSGTPVDPLSIAASTFDSVMGPIGMAAHYTTFGAFTTLIQTAINDSPGSATWRFYVDGVLRGSMSGLSLEWMTSTEQEIQMGCVFHTGTGECFNWWTGWSFQLIYTTQYWDATKCASFHAAPNQGLLF